MVVVLSPGIHSETAFDQAYLASVLGFPLVESADLVVRDGKLWMRSLGTLKRVDVVLRRVDADYADPLDLRADSRLGVVGLVEVQRRGAVTVVNTLGSGILESPGLLRFLPALAERLLGETPLLQTAPVFWGGIDAERSPPSGASAVAVDQAHHRRGHDRRARAVGAPAGQPGRAYRGDTVAVGRPGTAPVLLGANGLPRQHARVGGRGTAAVHRVAARRLRPDDRRPRLRDGARQRCVHVEYRCRQGCLGPTDGAHAGRDGDGAVGGPADDDRCGNAGCQLAARAVGPVLDGALRRAGREPRAASDRHA